MSDRRPWSVRVAHRGRPHARVALPGLPMRGLSASAQDVLDSLRTLGPTSCTALAEHTGRSRRLTGELLWRLHARGLVAHDGRVPPARRTWRLTGAA